MTTMLLAEEVFLLAHREEPGKAGGTLALDNGLAGCPLRSSPSARRSAIMVAVIVPTIIITTN